MGLRAPCGEIQIPNLNQFQALKWHTLECELVTPMYGGGVDAATVDLKMPIRVSAIKGQLRFWWRLLAKNKKDDSWNFNGNLKTIRDAEFALWGGQGDDDGGRASQVFLKVTQPKVTHHDLMSWQDLRLPYVMFPASNETNPDISHQVLKTEKAQFKLDFAFSDALLKDPDKIQQVIETLRWWANFGGLGARTRKGLGAIHVSQSPDFEDICKPLTDTEVKTANCAMSLKGQSGNALNQLQYAVQKLNDFRQGRNVGRNQGQQANRPGRSRWPEPDALRRIQRTHHENHAPEHQAGNVFPRAFFGLPIIFHFVGRGEPRDSQLAPIDGDRLASPLFIRPFYLGKNGKGEKEWASCALVTPYEHIKNMNVSLGRNETYPVWKSDTAQHIRPIQDQQGTDPLDAFLKYFAK
ncbi:type III-B CRISPR module RAMP protein Cmr1 [Acinetobacter indicus]|uniref:type III-B CRISPR module RAMP protein Cmr1 n=1 Tax=Acinetobacter indicus TaxID=756892 RepID=UPI000CEC97A6|nr:type III-B CRISPR module RAMP protein Cmr1 [Acinetobacter indicus]